MFRAFRQGWKLMPVGFPLLRQELQKGTPEQRDPSEKDQPSRVRVSNQHILEVGLCRVCVVPDKHNHNHFQKMNCLFIFSRTTMFTIFIYIVK